MDQVDKGILFDLSRNCRTTFEDLSRKYGITANAIKRRVQKLEESGVISQYTVDLNPAMVDVNFLFGLVETDGSNNERELVQLIGNNPYVIAAAAYTDGHYALVAEYTTANELSQIGSFLRSLDGVVSVECHTFLRPPGKKAELKNLHLRVLACLLKDARMSIVEIVSETGLSARRVRRALNELIEGQGVRFRALLELGAAGSVPYLIHCHYDESKVDHNMIAEWLETEFVMQYWESYISAQEPIFFSLFAVNTLTELEAMVQEVRKKDFITTTKVLIGYHHDYFPTLRRRRLLEMLDESGYSGNLSTTPL